MDRKPEYQMADGLPLILWDCIYSEEDVQWQIDGGGGENGLANGAGGVVISLQLLSENICH